MKKIFYSILAMLMLATTATVFTSCNDSEDTMVVIQVGVEKLQYSGMSEAELSTLMDFSSQVEAAYLKALGMGSENILIKKNEDYNTVCSDMKKKFESTVLPSAPELKGSYELIYKLTASDGGDKQTVLATKTFSNK